MDKDSVIAAIKRKFTHLSDEDINDIYDIALGDYLNIVFPFDKSVHEIPDDRKRDYYWIRVRMIDIVERSGVSSAKAYSENGLSISFTSAYITQELKSQLVPYAKVLK